MDENHCPHCGEPLAAGQINITTGVAFCAACNHLAKLDEVIGQADFATVLAKPPKGCRAEYTGDQLLAVASLRSIGGLLGSLGVAIFWNGIVSVFVVLAIAGLWANLIGQLPDWLPAPIMNDQPMSLGMTLFLCLFLTPFVGIGSCMIAAVFLYGRGDIRVRIGADKGFVSTGIGLIRWTRRFSVPDVRRVELTNATIQSEDQAARAIRIDASDPVKFGSMLTQRRCEWMHALLHVVLVMPDSPRRERLLSSALEPKASV